MSQPNKSHAWYALRRSVPQFRFDELLQELIDYLPRYGMDEIIVIVDAEEFFHGQPHLEWIRTYQEKLFRIKEEMAKIGVVYSLNPWITQGHVDRGRDARNYLPGIQTIVYPDGSQASCIACPLGDIWKQNMISTWTLLAETAPTVLWIEDDIRTFGNATCFCPLHLERISEKIGYKISRTQLVDAILKAGKPDPLRIAYLQTQADIMNETVAFLAKIVHKFSPQTSMGLMSSGPRNHCREGRRWNDFAKALANGTEPVYSRPTMGNYWEDSMRGFYFSQDSVKITRHCMPEGSLDFTEIENIPFTRYANSKSFTFLKAAVSFAYGAKGVTVNIFDHLGTAMESEAHFGQILAHKKDFLNALAEKTQKKGTYRGIGILHNDNAAYTRILECNQGFEHLAEEGVETVQAFEAHGIPTTYDENNVLAMTGQQPRMYDDKTIEKMLSKAMFLDGTAAAILHEKGFGKWTGLDSINNPAALETLGAFAAEEFFNPEFGGNEKKYMTSLLPTISYEAKLAVAKPIRETQIISRMVDPNTNPVIPCMFAFENQLGGRIVVHLWDYASAVGISFYNPYRKIQLQQAVNWLYRGKTPLLVNGDGVYPLASRKDFYDQTVIGFFNLTLDPWQFVEFQLADERSIDKVSLLSENGIWKKCSSMTIQKNKELNILTYNEPITFDKPHFWLIDWKC